MNTFILIILIAAAVGVLVALKAKASPNGQPFSFDARGVLFSPAERSFLGVLEQALGDRYRVFGKVRLGDLVLPSKGLSKSRRTIALNKSNQKHLDFVICSAADLSVLGVVELDDQSHARQDRAGRDDFVDKALASAKIPVARFSAKRAYSIPEVREMLAGAIARQPNESDAKRGSAPEAVESQTITAHAHVQSEAAPFCPKCAAVMVKRQAKNGEHAGKFFWACSAYPKCRQVVRMEEFKY